METIVLVTVVVFGVCLYQYLQGKSKKASDLPSKGEENNSNVSTDTELDPSEAPDYSCYTENYNFRRAMELINQQEEREAFEYLKKAIDDDENNGYAHAWIGRLYFDYGNNSMALKAINSAITLLPGINQEPFYTLRSRIHRNLGDTEAWKTDAEKASEFDATATEPLDELSNYYFEKQMYDESDSLMDKFIEIEPHNPYGYMVKGRNQMMRGKLDEAFSLYEYANKLDKSYGPAYSFMADVCLQQGRLSDSVEYEIQALGIMIKNREDDQKTVYVRNMLAQRAYPLFCLKLKAQIEKVEDKEPWYGMLGVVHSAACHFVEAAACYHETYRLCHSAADLNFEAYCWQKFGDYSKAAGLLEQAVAADPENTDYREKLMLAKAELGLFEEALAIGEYIIQKEPDNIVAHYNCGRMKQMLGQYTSAVKDFDTVLVLSEEKNAYALLYRGAAKASMGDVDGAIDDFQKITADPQMEGYRVFNCLAKVLLNQYGNYDVSTDITVNDAFIDLNQDVEVLLKKANDDSESKSLAIEGLVSRISVCSRIGLIDQALSDMRTILSLGGRRFYNYRHSFEYEPLRTVPEFEAMLCEYETMMQKQIAELSLNTEACSQEGNGVRQEQYSIPFTKEGSLCKVPCEINSLPLHFLFDTGASEVSMSSVEATFMLKHGYLKQQDISGKEYFMTANGEISEGTVVKLREVNFGGVKLNNVRASIVKNQKAPLLLGQTVLGHLVKIEIDNDTNTINVTR